LSFLSVNFYFILNPFRSCFRFFVGNCFSLENNFFEEKLDFFMVKFEFCRHKFGSFVNLFVLYFLFYKSFSFLHFLYIYIYIYIFFFKISKKISLLLLLFSRIYLFAHMCVVFSILGNIFLRKALEKLGFLEIRLPLL